MGAKRTGNCLCAKTSPNSIAEPARANFAPDIVLERRFRLEGAATSLAGGEFEQLTAWLPSLAVETSEFLTELADLRPQVAVLIARPAEGVV